MKTPGNHKEKDIEAAQHAQDTTMEEISAIRAKKHQPDLNRVADFEKNTIEAPLSEKPLQARITTIHPDGKTSIQVANDHELLNTLLAVYEDGHGDFGLYDLPHEPIPADDKSGLAVSQEPYSEMKILGFIPHTKAEMPEITDEEWESIMDEGERPDSELNYYDEAVEWQRNQYGDDDISLDDTFDLEH